MNSFLFALNAIAPIVLMISLGYLLRRMGLIDIDFAKRANKLVFRVFLPVMLFLNVYKIEAITDMRPGYAIYAVMALLVLYAVSVPAVMLFVKDGAKRGSLLQAVFRSNYALIGIPLAESLFGQEGVAVASVLSAIIIPIYNVLAVVSLSVFSVDGKRVSPRKILVGIAKNPLIDSVVIGLIVLAIRAVFERHGIAFRISDIKPVFSAASSIGALATPLALLMLGAQFEFSAIKGSYRELIFGVAAKCLVVPVLSIGAAYIFFRESFGGAQFAALVAMFTTPVAVSSVPMAQEMGADDKLAGQIVVATTLASSLTVFVATTLLKSAGIF